MRTNHKLCNPDADILQLMVKTRDILISSQVMMALVVTDVVEINFDSEYITLNVEFVLRWKVNVKRQKQEGRYIFLFLAASDPLCTN